MSDMEQQVRNPFYRLYNHAAGIAGAVGLLNIFKNVVEWRSFFLGLIYWWQQYITPLSEAAFSWMPLVWPFGWPPWGYDYIVFSLLFGLGGARIAVPGVFSGEESDFMPVRGSLIYRQAVYLARGIGWITAMLVTIALLWPLFIALFIFVFVAEKVTGGKISLHMLRIAFMFFSPFIYFCIFVLLNYALFFAPGGATAGA